MRERRHLFKFFLDFVAAQHLLHSIVVDLAFPFGDDNRRDAITDEIGQRARGSDMKRSMPRMRASPATGWLVRWSLSEKSRWTSRSGHAASIKSTYPFHASVEPSMRPSRSRALARCCDNFCRPFGTIWNAGTMITTPPLQGTSLQRALAREDESGLQQGARKVTPPGSKGNLPVAPDRQASTTPRLELPR